MEIITGIYQIQSLSRPERRYIGSAVNIHQRWGNHLRTLRRGVHRSPKLQRHYSKYGESDLIFSIITECSKATLIAYEQFYIDSFLPYFNTCLIAGSRMGQKHNKQTKEKISRSLTGKSFSEETKKRLSESHMGLNTWLKGKKLSKDHCQKVSNSLLGNKRCVGRVPWNKGLKQCHSEEALAKMRRPKSKLHRKHLCEAQKRRWELKKIYAGNL